ncbi:hypothetical protein AJ80_05698 [Polytolypa hystricis UAMH7299]|uniref:Rhodopsin domain-containing protein n=1 Tax=Polytolypa hystricis (strain UAMH7299) TaxID=1447883 RepID=A0A2B7Y1Z8_POLH7|nr:hypothetical protein AJ80_05698 [Polytolypa hystricis UAMH7299]
MDLATTPGMAPPDGHIPQFDAPYNMLQVGTVIAFGVTYFVATVFLFLRYFQSLKLVQKVEIDLVIVSLSYGVALFYFVTLVNLMGYGWGKHLWDVSLADLMEFNKILLPNTLAYLICPSITKMGMLAVLYRINPSIIYRSIVVAIAVAIIAYTAALCSITGGPCSPLKEGTLNCLQGVALSHAVLNIASDFAVLAVPIPTIYSLKLTLKQKISLGCLLGVGSGVIICSIARLPYVVILPNEPDATYYQAILGVWSIVEVNLGVICACAMRLKPLIKTYLPQLGIFSSRSRSTNNNKNKSQHSYQLHSIQKGSAHAHPAAGSSDNHQVYRSYKIDDAEGTDNGSTDKILT